MVNRYLAGALITGAALFGGCDDKSNDDLEKMVSEPVRVVQSDEPRDVRDYHVVEKVSPKVETYFVQAGDNWGNIANRKFGMKLAEMARINPTVKDKGKLSIGQELNVINYAGVDTGMADVYKTNDFSGDSDKVLLARLLFGETQGCSKAEMIDAGLSVPNRVGDGKKWNGENVRDVILCAKQYSCFNDGDAAFERLKNPVRYGAKVFKECLDVAGGILDGKYDDLNKGQTHFYNPRKCNPAWKDSEDMTRIKMKGAREHLYFKEN